MKVKVGLDERSYEVTYHSSLDELSSELPDFSSGHHIIITDAAVYSHYSSFIEKAFRGVDIITIEAGENSKNLQTIEELAEQLVEKGADRRSILWAIGGGVVGDITGFLSSVYMRGTMFMQIPTTLLAMVDSSVGGKTGVNLKSGKNLVGNFHQPSHVYICTDFLKTLPEKQVRAGMAEVVKSSLIKSRMFFAYISDHVPAILNREGEVMQTLSHESVKIKASIVEKDETEAGVRALLNFGHTLGHAIEAYLDYSKLLHGEAVSIGMAFAAYLSVRRGMLSHDKFELIDDLLGNLNLPRRMSDIPGFSLPEGLNRLVDRMKADKKNRSGEIRMVLLKSIGHAQLPEPVNETELKGALGDFANL